MADAAVPGPVKLWLGKCWQGEPAFLLWQIAPAPGFQAQPPAQRPAKLFLLVDAQQASRGVSLLSHKPGALKPQGGIAALVRKYVPSASLANIWRDQDKGAIWLPLWQGGEVQWFLHLSAAKPPDLSLISRSGETYFRFGQKGVFTKRKGFPRDELPLGGSQPTAFVDILPELWAAAVQAKAEAAEASAESGEHAGATLDAQRAFSAQQSEARKKLARRIKTGQKSWERQSADAPSEAAIALLQREAVLLQAHVHRVGAQSWQLTLTPEETGEAAPLTLELDPNLSPGQNVTASFQRLKKAKKASALAKERLAQLYRELQSMKADLELLKAQPLGAAALQQILAKYQLDKNKERPAVKSQPEGLHQPYRIFAGRDGARFYVGKSPRDNDVLTKNARGNDLWVHVIGTTGSHVIIPAKSLKQQGLTAAIKKEAAILAIHFSKLREDKAGEVYITQKQHLRKQKGLAPGLWLVDQSETFFVRYTPEELQSLLNQTL